ncbi:MAG TPA: hypothetical protein DIW45_04670 [Erythrobacter sp.]|nr:hypothetical protein [Erythrobacter sp.]
MMATEAIREAAMEAYRDAYEAANGYRPRRVRYEGGWYRLPMNQSVRHEQLLEYTERLVRRAAA